MPEIQTCFANCFTLFCIEKLRRRIALYRVGECGGAREHDCPIISGKRLIQDWCEGGVIRLTHVRFLRHESVCCEPLFKFFAPAFYYKVPGKKYKIQPNFLFLIVSFFDCRTYLTMTLPPVNCKIIMKYYVSTLFRQDNMHGIFSLIVCM